MVGVRVGVGEQEVLLLVVENNDHLLFRGPQSWLAQEWKLICCLLKCHRHFLSCLLVSFLHTQLVLVTASGFSIS